MKEFKKSLKLILDNSSSPEDIAIQLKKLDKYLLNNEKRLEIRKLSRNLKTRPVRINTVIKLSKLEKEHLISLFSKTKKLYILKSILDLTPEEQLNTLNETPKNKISYKYVTDYVRRIKSSRKVDEFDDFRDEINQLKDITKIIWNVLAKDMEKYWQNQFDEQDVKFVKKFHDKHSRIKDKDWVEMIELLSVLIDFKLINENKKYKPLIKAIDV